MKTSIIYNSHTGITKAFAEEIGKFLSEKGIDHKVASKWLLSRKAVS